MTRGTAWFFDKLEMLMAVGYEFRNPHEWNWMPVGAFIYRKPNKKYIMEEIKKSLSEEQDQSTFVTAGLSGLEGVGSGSQVVDKGRSPPRSDSVKSRAAWIDEAMAVVRDMAVWRAAQ